MAGKIRQCIRYVKARLFVVNSIREIKIGSVCSDEWKLQSQLISWCFLVKNYSDDAPCYICRLKPRPHNLANPVRTDGAFSRANSSLKKTTVLPVTGATVQSKMMKYKKGQKAVAR